MYSSYNKKLVQNSNQSRTNLWNSHEHTPLGGFIHSLEYERIEIVVIAAQLGAIIDIESREAYAGQR
ncbi:hypothetical protein DC345_26120 [Paenibacillus taichungensis]|uniref:Uncharacterized protein n=1 Tax=Paenibacillus taichungensis TaxID=484184 RepID=A0A329QKI7_9BACL|nr:hypothetical protein DC345_26120 [Paenibacillus taichungensis]